MDILKAATEWTKAEIFSSSFFIVFGIGFAITSFGFAQLGKTELAKAFVIPTLVAGLLLLIIGIGLVYTNQTRLKQFPKAYEQDATTFVQSELDRTERTLAEYQNVVFKAIPIIIMIASLLLILFNKPMWRAICITVIAMMAVILLIDSNANTRMEEYQQQLIVEKSK